MAFFDVAPIPAVLLLVGVLGVFVAFFHVISLWTKGLIYLAGILSVVIWLLLCIGLPTVFLWMFPGGEPKQPFSGFPAQFFQFFYTNGWWIGMLILGVLLFCTIKAFTTWGNVTPMRGAAPAQPEIQTLEGCVLFLIAVAVSFGCLYIFPRSFPRPQPAFDELHEVAKRVRDPRLQAAVYPYFRITIPADYFETGTNDEKKNWIERVLRQQKTLGYEDGVKDVQQVTEESDLAENRRIINAVVIYLDGKDKVRAISIPDSFDEKTSKEWAIEMTNRLRLYQPNIDGTPPVPPNTSLKFPGLVAISASPPRKS